MATRGTISDLPLFAFSSKPEGAAGGGASAIDLVDRMRQMAEGGDNTIVSQPGGERKPTATAPESGAR